MKYLSILLIAVIVVGCQTKGGAVSVQRVEPNVITIEERILTEQRIKDLEGKAVEVYTNMKAKIRNGE